MARWIPALTLLLLLLSPTSRAFAQEAPPPSAAAEAAFEKAVKFLETRKFTEALEQLKLVLKEDPEEPAALWNAGMASYAIKEYASSKDYFIALKKQTPNDGFLRAKLIQTYQALGDKPARDKERADLMALRLSKKDDSQLAKERSFCRDRFVTEKGQEVFVYEMFVFEPKYPDDGKFAVRYNAIVMGPDEKIEQRIEIGQNTVAKNAKGEWVKAGEISAFYFDAYPKTGPYSRITYGLYEKELPYDEVHKLLVDILAGKVKPVSGAMRKTTP